MNAERVIWITGGGTGIGRSLALHWAKLGHRVVVSGRRLEKLEETAQLASKFDGEIFPIVCDVTDEEAADRCAAQIALRFGRLDVCVANAGFGVVGKFESLTSAEWRRQMDVNFFGAIWTMRASLKYLRQSKGRLAVISSLNGKLAVTKLAAYSASKFALVGVCNTLYQELQGSGVSITNIIPGLVESDIALTGNDGVFNPTRVDRRPKRFMWTSEHAAIDIAKAIERRKREAVITGHGKFAVFLVNHFSGATYWILSRQRKEYL